MEIELDFNKTLEQNATAYYEKSKLAVKKIEGIKKSVDAEKQKAERKKIQEQKRELTKNSVRGKAWYHEYRWMISSEGYLVIGGRDAKTNEDIVKNRMAKNDLYFHADVFGAPHCIIKNGIKATELTKQEASEFAAVFSKAWEEGRPLAEVYSVTPENVSKKAPTGESIGKGAFMIYGEREWRKAPLTLGVGWNEKEKAFMCGPLVPIKKNCSIAVKLIQGKESKEKIAKKIVGIFTVKGIECKEEDFVSGLPAGNFEIVAQ
jgi:predicted ribosome quality control (RQC) complex YloA/Tae2 family protein